MGQMKFHEDFIRFREVIALWLPKYKWIWGYVHTVQIECAKIYRSYCSLIDLISKKKSHIISVGDINLLLNLLLIFRDHVQMLFYIIAKTNGCKFLIEFKFSGKMSQIKNVGTLGSNLADDSSSDSNGDSSTNIVSETECSFLLHVHDCKL